MVPEIKSVYVFKLNPKLIYSGDDLLDRGFRIKQEARGNNNAINRMPGKHLLFKGYQDTGNW